MVTRKRLVAWILPAMLMVLAISGCVGQEKLLEISDVLPPTYREAGVPRDIVKNWKEMFDEGLGWMRCFDCSMDWHELNRYISTAVDKYGYSDYTDTWVPIFAEGDDELEVVYHQVYKVYTSQSKLCHVMVMNLDYIKTTYSISTGSGGDYLVIVGYDTTLLEQN